MSLDKRRRVDDRYQALRTQGRVWAFVRAVRILVPSLIAIGAGYALGPFIGPLF